MNVLQIANYNAPYAGNFILSLQNLETHIDGDTVYLFPCQANDKAFVSQLHSVYYYSGNVILDLFLICKIIRTHKIDIIHSHFPSSKNNLLLLLCNLLIFRRLIFVRHAHSEHQNALGYRLLIRKILRNYVNIHIACNYPIYTQLVEDGINKKKVITVTNAIDFLRLDQYKDFDKKDDTNIQILMFGSDWYRKGGDIAIKAISEMNNNITLNIVLSHGLDKVKKNILKDFGEIPFFVRFLPPISDIATYYHFADIFISPSRSEGLPYAIIESMYCRTMVIASDILPQQKILPNYLMFKTENHISLKESIDYVLKIDDKSEILNSLHNKSVLEYSIDSWSNKVMQVYLNMYENEI